MLIRRKLIERKAREVVEEHGSNELPVNVEEIAKSLGVTVVADPSSSDDISGFFILDEGQPIIGVNAKHSPARQRFTIAHELGHYLLHRPGEGVAYVDKAFLVKFRNAESSSGEYSEEIEANLFAAELLMPHSEIQKAISQCSTFDAHDDDRISELANRFGVSQQALLIRLGNLGLVRI